MHIQFIIILIYKFLSQFWVILHVLFGKFNSTLIAIFNIILMYIKKFFNEVPGAPHNRTLRICLPHVKDEEVW